MAALSDEQIQLKHRELQLTYKDYLRLDKNLENIKVDNYYILQQIGEGAFAQVYRGINQIENKQVAVKVLNLRSIETQTNSKVKSIRKRLAHEESKIMMKFDCPNLLKCYECFENRDLKFMIIEYCNQGSLQDKIDTLKKIPEVQAVSILKQIINGIGECHKQKIIHRDLKADNILIHNGQYKIADFGFSKILSITTENQLTRNTVLGTMTTMAPEVLNRQPYGLKADIWSIGVIFFQMLFGECPFKSNTSAQMVTQIMSSKLLSQEEYKGVKPSIQARKFLCEVLVVDINKRLGWRELLEHELFKTQQKQLPENFHRQALMKGRDEILEQLQRDFVCKNQSDPSILVSASKSTATANDMNKIDQSQKKTSYQDQKSNHLESMNKNKQKEEEIQVQKPISKTTPEFKNYEDIENRDRFQFNPQISQNTREQPKKQQKKEEQLKKSDSPHKKQEELKISEKNGVQAQNKKQAVQSQNIKESPQKATHSQDNNTNLKPALNISQDVYSQHNKKKPEPSKNDNTNLKSSDNAAKFKKVDKSQLQKIKKKVNRQQDQAFKWAKRIHVECLKTQCIYNNIICPIQDYNLIDLKTRQNMQMMYLICTRCLNNISPINIQYEKRKNNPIIKDLHALVSSLYKKVIDKWMKYSNLLTSKQNQKFVIIKDWFSKKLNKEEINKKNKFLTGIQCMTEFRPGVEEQKTEKKNQFKKQDDLLDYDKEEQIDFTNGYIQQSLKNIKFNQRATQLRNHLIHYRDICRIEAEDLKNRAFKDYLKLLLL